MISGRNLAGVTHRRKRNDEEDGYRNRPPSGKAGKGDYDQKGQGSVGLGRNGVGDEMKVRTDCFIVFAAGVSCMMI